MSCMLYVVGRRFDVEAYLKRTESEADDVWTRGQRPRPGSQPAKVSGFGYWIGPRNFGPLKKQVNAAVRFLESPENVRMLEGLTGEPTKRASKAGRRSRDCAVPVLYLILRFLEDLAGSGGSDPA